MHFTWNTHPQAMIASASTIVEFLRAMTPSMSETSRLSRRTSGTGESDCNRLLDGAGGDRRLRLTREARPGSGGVPRAMSMTNRIGKAVAHDPTLLGQVRAPSNVAIEHSYCLLLVVLSRNPQFFF